MIQSSMKWDTKHRNEFHSESYKNKKWSGETIGKNIVISLYAARSEKWFYLS